MILKHLEILKKSVDEWNSWRRGIKVKANLSGADLSKVHLNGADLSGANLSGANLNGSDLREADLREANLSEAILSDANLSGVDLSGANLKEAVLNGAEFKEADLIESNLARTSSDNANFIKAKFYDAVLSNACFTNTNFSKSTFENANLERVNFHKCSLSGANLRKSKLSFAKFSNSNFENAIIDDASFFNIKIEATTFKNASINRIKDCSTDIKKYLLDNGAIIESSNLEKLNIILENTNLKLRVAEEKIKRLSSTSIPAIPIWQNRNFEIEKDCCFIIMPFKKEKNLNHVYNDHIKKIIESFELRCIRADDIFKHEMIMEDIWEQICIAKFIIGDLTDKNPNVFYELGMAHTLGKRVLLITQSEDDVPFDLRHLRYIKYEFTPPGMKEFENKLEKAINFILK